MDPIWINCLIRVQSDLINRKFDLYQTSALEVFENYDMHGSKVTRLHQISQIPTPHLGHLRYVISSVENTAPK